MIYHLAEQPDPLVPLREELEACLVADGWTAAALGKMRKLDSILRETLRHNGIALGADALPFRLSPARFF